MTGRGLWRAAWIFLVVGGLLCLVEYGESKRRLVEAQLAGPAPVEVEVEVPVVGETADAPKWFRSGDTYAPGDLFGHVDPNATILAPESYDEHVAHMKSLLGMNR